MKLSEAIRLGAMLKPQAFNGTVTADGTCALAAAAEALGIAPVLLNVDTGEYVVSYGALSAAFPSLETHEVALPCKPCEYTVESEGTRPLQSAIFHLNDSHKWSRERIADWVQTIEDQQPVADVEKVG